MPQSSLARSPVTTSIAANKKFVSWLPRYLLNGVSYPKPGINTPNNIGLPIATASNLSVGSGGSVSVTQGTWESTYPITSYTYSWLRNGVTISGATASTYSLQSADIGANIGAKVGAVNTGGTSYALSNTVGPVVA